MNDCSPDSRCADEGGHPIESPCIKVCELDERIGLCLGCFRTLDEISSWGSMSEAERAGVIADLPSRRAVDLPPRRATD